MQFLEELARGLQSVRIGPESEVKVSELSTEMATRRDGIDASHVDLLASTSGPLPPVLIDRATGAIIDGAQRVMAALRPGDDTISARGLDGDPTDLFIVAVRANTASLGKPLTLAEREDAASKILVTHSDWSDRAIGLACGLSGKTVASLRVRRPRDESGPATREGRTADRTELPFGAAPETRCSSGEFPQLNGATSSPRRIGRDGKSRPIDRSVNRRRAAELLQIRPNASLRAIARECELSPATVRDVRERLREGTLNARQEVTAPPHDSRRHGREPSPGDGPGAGPSDSHPILSDNAFQGSPDTVRFASWFEARILRPDEWEDYIEQVPKGRIYMVVDEARSCADRWRRFADLLEARVNGRGRVERRPAGSETSGVGSNGR